MSTPPFTVPVEVDAHGVSLKLPNGGDYFIDWSRIKDRDDLLAWLEHLAGKQWVTPEAKRAFIALVREHHGWPRRFV